MKNNRESNYRTHESRKIEGVSKVVIHNLTTISLEDTLMHN